MVAPIALTVGSRLALTALSLISSIITARVLGESGRGDYFFMVTLSATLVQLTNLGLPVSASYDVARDEKTLPGLVANALWVSIVGAGGAGLLLALSAHALGELENTPTSYLLLAAALAPPSLFFMIVANIFAGQQRFVAFNLVEAGSRALAVCCIVTAGLLGAGPGGFIGAAIACWVVASAASAWVVLRGSSLRGRFDKPLFVSGFRYATKAYLIALLAFLVLRANIFLLRRDYGAGELGLYSIAAQLSDVLAIVPQAISLVLFPRLVRERAGNRWGATVRSAATTGGLLLVACGITAAIAEPMIRVVFGAGFVPAAEVLRIMLPGVVCLGITNILLQYLGAEGIPRVVVVVWTGAAVLLGVLSFLLIPDHAGAGAAAALSVTYAVLLVAVFGVARQHVRAERHERAPVSPIRLDPEEVPPAAE